MASLYNKIKIYLEENSKTDDELYKNIVLQNDTGTDYIKTWNVSGLAKPTDSQLNALESKADTLNTNNGVRATRSNLYGDIGEQLDEIYKDIDAWKARIKKIKDDNPKS